MTLTQDYLTLNKIQQIFAGLQHVFNVTIFYLSRRLEDTSQDILKTSWKTKNYYAEEVLKTCLEDILKRSWRQTKCLLGIPLFNKSIFDTCISEESNTNSK